MNEHEQLDEVSLAQEGDADALHRLWESSRRWVAAVLLAHKDRDADLEDLLQEVALRLVRGIENLDEAEAFGPWLRQIAINVARAEGRKKTNRTRLMKLVRYDIASKPTGDSRPGTQRSAKDSLGTLESLPETYREALMLRCVRGMSYRAISAVTGLPETTIETRIARARRMVREQAAQAEAEK